MTGKLHTGFILLSIAALIVFSGCQSSVRFADSASGKSSKGHYARSDKKTEKPKKVVKESGYVIEYVSRDASRNDIIEEAETWIGTPYKWGGEDKDGADCSGFVQSTFKTCGIKLPRTSYDQFDTVEKIEKDDLQAGDLLFFKRRSKVSHVGIYIGGNRMIHASSKKGVIIQDLTDYYYFKEDNHFAGCGRVLRD